MISTRPKVDELVFQLYGRSMHPELFEIQETREIDRGGYRASVSITSAGHLVTWRRGGLTLTEVATSASQPLPQKRRLLSHKLRGERNDRMECRGGSTYQMAFQLETVEPEVFWNFQREICVDGGKSGLFHRFDSGARMALGAVSWVNVETRARSLLVQAFHTFPDDLAIVKSQSLFETPS